MTKNIVIKNLIRQHKELSEKFFSYKSICKGAKICSQKMRDIEEELKKLGVEENILEDMIIFQQYPTYQD